MQSASSMFANALYCMKKSGFGFLRILFGQEIADWLEDQPSMQTSRFILTQVRTKDSYVI